MQKFRIVYCLCLVACLCLWLAFSISPANAGTYTVSYSGGQVVVTDTYGNVSTVPYSLSNGNWGGTGTGYWSQHSGSAICQNQITSTFTWQSSGAGDDPPSSVIVTDSSTVNFMLAGTGTVNACSDGLGDAQTGTPTSGSSSGTRYQVIQNPGSSFSITCAPSMNISGTGYPNYGYVTVSATYSAIATPVEIALSGVTTFNNSNNILIGQGVNVSLSTPGFTQSVWQWAITGDPFAGFQTTATTGNAVELTADTLQKASFTYYYRSIAGNNFSPSTVSCSATIIDPKGVTHQVSATTQINVYKPAFSINPITGNMDLIIAGATNTLIADGDANYNQGITWTGSVTTPSPFVGESSGVWGFAQIITVNLSVVIGGVPANIPFNGQTGLDNVFIYDDNPFPANGTAYHDGDSPAVFGTQGQTLPTLLSLLSMNDTFKTYILYQPENLGVGTTWVPLYEIDWHAKGSAIYNFTTHMLQLQDGSSVKVDNSNPTSVLPSWTLVITNT